MELISVTWNISLNSKNAKGISIEYTDFHHFPELTNNKNNNYNDYCHEYVFIYVCLYIGRSV